MSHFQAISEEINTNMVRKNQVWYDLVVRKDIL
jgi:hypothetical protein